METTENKRKKRKRKPKHIFRKILCTLLVLLILAGGIFYAINSLRAEYTVTYQGYNASIGTISNALSFNGTLQAVHSGSYTAQEAGTVKTVYKAAGEAVADGDRIMKLSNGQVVKAEFDGTVNTIEFNEGDSVVAGDVLCTVVDFAHLKTSIRVDEYDINSVQVGDAIKVTTVANEKDFDATIAAINHTSSSTGTVAYYTATAYVDVTEGVYPGMQVTVTLPQEEAENVVVLKMDAISFNEDNEAFVYYKDEAGEMQPQVIATGVSNGTYVEIKEGVVAGDTVYAVAKTSTTDPMALMMSNMFGQTRTMGPGTNRNRNSTGSGMGNFDPSSMPGAGGSTGGYGGGGR